MVTNKVYNNYFSGSVLQISECLEIILYNSSSFTELLSLYNLDSFYLKNLVRTSDKYIRLYRDQAWTVSESGEKASVPFEYKKYLEKGFDVIVYISNVSSRPIGYTEYVNIQGVGLALGITIDHRSTSSGKTTQNRLPIGFLSDYLFSGIVVITLHKLQFVSSPGPGRVRGGTPCRVRRRASGRRISAV